MELRGLYLGHELQRRGRPSAPFVYADFVSSLDGRIAVADLVPPELTGGNDLRLLLELQAQADCVITHGGYLRALSQGRLGDILEVGAHEETRDLAIWRRTKGLALQPAVVVVSASLDFPIPPSIAGGERRVIIATTQSTPARRVEAWRNRGYEMLIAGQGDRVEAGELTVALGRLGFQSLFLLTGPRMLESALRAGVLSRLYLTLVHRMLGGERVQTMISGPQLGAAGRLRLGALYHDREGPDGSSQWFAEFEPVP